MTLIRVTCTHFISRHTYFKVCALKLLFPLVLLVKFDNMKKPHFICYPPCLNILTNRYRTILYITQTPVSLVAPKGDLQVILSALT